jgi:CTP synthase
VVGKYINLNDSYKSVDEALFHGGIANNVRTELVKIDSEKIEKEDNLEVVFRDIGGIFIPGGFGQRGIEGMIRAAGYTKTHGIPCFGICLGMQVMVIEHARSRMNLADANSTEFDPDTTNPVISLLEEQVDITLLGGTMRLGLSESRLNGGSRISSIYAKESIFERHRHRYEVSNRYRDILKKSGLVIGGLTQDGSLVESVEWPDHPWGIGVQFHPEFISKPDAAHPLFESFVRACMTNGKGQ